MSECSCSKGAWDPNCARHGRGRCPSCGGELSHPNAVSYFDGEWHAGDVTALARCEAESKEFQRDVRGWMPLKR